MQAECGRYVALSQGEGMESEKQEEHEDEEKKPLTGTQLTELYLSLRQGHSVKTWCMEHAEAVGKMDVRRFITFGVIKGFLYRVHKYAFVATSIHRSHSKKLTRANLQREKLREAGMVKKKGKEKEENEQGKAKAKAKGKVGGEKEKEKEKEKENVDGDGVLGRYLDGTHCFDEICTDLMISEKELTARLKAWGDVQIICR